MADACKQAIRDFVSSSRRVSGLADDQDIFADGMVNSLFAMQLVLFVEKTFGIAVTDDDLDFDNFRTIDAIASFVARKIAPAGRAPAPQPPVVTPA